MENILFILKRNKIYLFLLQITGKANFSLDSKK